VLVLEAPNMADVVIEVTADGGVEVADATGRRSYPAPVTVTEVVTDVLLQATIVGANVASLTPRWGRAPVG
jgi:hypothetical protein